MLLGHPCASPEPPLPARAASALPGASVCWGATRNSLLPGFFFPSLFRFHCREQRVQNKQRVGVQRQPQCLGCPSPPHCHRAWSLGAFLVQKSTSIKNPGQKLKHGLFLQSSSVFIKDVPWERAGQDTFSESLRSAFKYKSHFI